MEWRGDEVKISQLCQLFDLASSPDNLVQQQVWQKLSEFGQMVDFNMYLVTIFAKLPGLAEVVRQRAGLLLKTNLLNSQTPIAAPMAVYIQASVLVVVRDRSRVIRHTAGTVISTIVERLGVGYCLQALNQLVECLQDGNPDTVEGSFNALNKICEDGISMLRHNWGGEPTPQSQSFIAWCAEVLLPRLFEYASPSATVVARQNAIECLNHFALGFLFSSPKECPQLAPFSCRYVEVLGVLANDSDVVVLKSVCRGFVCVMENTWDCLTEHTANVVLQYMLKACSHPEYGVRREALEVWYPCTNSPMIVLIKPMLPELVPVLVSNMVYTDADYCSMEQSEIQDDNAAVPDQAEDIRPRFHKESGGGDDEDRASGAFGAEWTARKAAANSLDQLANSLSQETLQIVLPVIQQKLEDSSWEVQESGVFALGAIAFGCMEGLVQFLPRVLELLLKLCEAPQALLRTISCWCASRFSQWICECEREEVLRSVLRTLLSVMLDRNKRVQEAACSAFSTLEEEARDKLLPYLDDIVGTLVRACQHYQAKNLLILYDAVGTLADSCELPPVYVERLLVLLMEKLDSAQDNDKSLVAILECFTSLAQNCGVACLPVALRLSMRSVHLIGNGARQAQLFQQNPNEFDRPDREVMAAGIDLLSGIVGGLGGRVKEILAEQNFVLITPELLEDTSLQVKQTTFALIGDCAKNCIEFLVPVLPNVLPHCAKSLRENTSAAVSSNASWALGEICIKVGPEYMAKYLTEVVPPLGAVLMRSRGSRETVLTTNVCITIGRLGLVCGPQMAKEFPEIAPAWCKIMKAASPDEEKENAFQGLVNMLKANPEACLQCVPELAGAICSFFPPPASLEPSFREILHSYKQKLGPSWPAVYQRFSDDLRIRLSHLYGLAQ